MGNEFNKTDADFTYDRYNTLRSAPEEQDMPLEELRPLGTITEQSASGEDVPADTRPLESALASHEPVGRHPIDFDGVTDDGADPALTGDSILAADIGLYNPEPELGRRAERHGGVLASPSAERDELVESDALFAAGAAGLTGGVIDYAEDEETGDYTGDQPLEDIPDADELQPGTAVDPAAPPVDVMPGTDLLNGSTGEEE
ncbi:hypothetical protein [Paenibacillus tengchongensis]|uniref:hypothetical protein n=1 Tax=Paenibacillus tengchongensis TaxID=2608684 RepID=UPI00124EFCAD|nr:hypothetical protein [Paenibacillus tengchongensis]